MIFLKQSTASQSVVIGPFVDSTDGNTAETGLTISNTDIRLSKNGGNIVAKNSGGGAHDEIGYYTITLDATDTNTVGRLQLMVHATGALPVYHEYQVVEEAIYDALFGSSASGFDASGRVDVGSWLGTAAATPTVAGVPEVDVTHVGGSAEDIATETKQDTAQTDLDTLTGSDGVTLATSQPNYAPNTTAPPSAADIRAEIDSNSTQLAAILTDTGTDIPATLSTIAGYLDTEIAAILEDTGTDIPALIAALDTLIDDIKAKTDSLTFSVTGKVDANVTHINEVELGGDGDGTPMGAA